MEMLIIAVLLSLLLVSGKQAPLLLALYHCAFVTLLAKYFSQRHISQNLFYKTVIALSIEN